MATGIILPLKYYKIFSLNVLSVLLLFYSYHFGALIVYIMTENTCINDVQIDLKKLHAIQKDNSTVVQPLLHSHVCI